MDEGFVKLYRRIVNWEWYTDANTIRVFIHLLLKANHKATKWRGQIIERGSFISSYGIIARELRLTVQKVRTSFLKLISTGEITYKSTSQYSIITINNYELYQENNKQNNNQITNNQQTNNKQITTNKNEKNEKNERNIISLSVANPDLIFDKNVNKVFELYKANCTSLVPLKFETRDITLRQTILDFLNFIDFDFSYFVEVCQKANKQVHLLDNKIDLKSLIKNHERLYSGFYAQRKNSETNTDKEDNDFKAEIKAIGNKYRALERAQERKNGQI